MLISSICDVDKSRIDSYFCDNYKEKQIKNNIYFTYATIPLAV